MRNKIKKIIVVVMATVIILTCCSCNSNSELIIHGGEMLRYSFCLSQNSEMPLMLPIISNKKISDISLEGAVLSENQPLVVAEGDVTYDNEKYNGKYINFISVTLSYSEENPDLNCSITGFNINVNGQSVFYETSDFHVCSTEYMEKLYDAKDSERNLLICSSLMGISGHELTSFDQSSFAVRPNQNITLNKYYIMNNYIELNNLCVNGTAVDSENINYDAEKDEEISLTYCSAYGENLNSAYVIRASQIILYTQEDGEKRVFVYTPGVYYYANFDEHGAIKNYIDQFLTEED